MEFLARLQADRRDNLREIATLDLLHELAARFLGDEPYPSSEEGIAVGKLLQDRLAEPVRYTREQIFAPAFKRLLLFSCQAIG